jgi:hypothetical protein
VAAIDPAALDPAVLALPNVTHLRMQAAHAVPALRELMGGDSADLLVCDINQVRTRAGGAWPAAGAGPRVAAFAAAPAAAATRAAGAAAAGWRRGGGGRVVAAAGGAPASNVQWHMACGGSCCATRPAALDAAP